MNTVDFEHGREMLSSPQRLGVVLSELGLLDEFLRLPHEKVTKLGGRFGKVDLPIADFSTLDTRCPFIALMPQWDFLDFLAREACKLPTFHLLMQTQASDLRIRKDGKRDRICGVLATSARAARMPFPARASGRPSRTISIA